MTESRLSIQSQPYTLQMSVEPSLIGPQALNLRTEDGMISLNVPLAAFPFLLPNEAVIVTIGITRVAVEPMPEPLVQLGSKLIGMN